VEHPTEDIIGGELDADEQLLWNGQPRQGFLLRQVDAFVIPFSLLWCGFAIVWEAAVLRTGAPWFFKFWGVPFVLLGLYFVVGRFWVDARRRARTFYAVTSERILIVSHFVARRVNSLSIDTISDVSLIERGGGAGTIAVGSTPPFSWWRANCFWPLDAHQHAAMFELGAEARQVYDLIRRTQRAARHGA
jgi:hypothetical protein